MQANTIMRLGSLALDLAQDQKVRELATMLHKGAKRRGLFAPQPMVPQTSLPQSVQGANSAGRVPFAPAPAPTPATHTPAAIGPSLPSWLNADTAKKALGVAGMLKDVLIK